MTTTNTNTNTTDRWGKARYHAVNPDGSTINIIVNGRVRWALECLIAAGEDGCTPITTPGPRWSDYVFRLRGEGLVIETIHEAHGGPFKGTHARYILKSKVTPATIEVEAA